MLINLYLIPTFYEKLLKDPGGNVGYIIIIFLPGLYTKQARNYCDFIFDIFSNLTGKHTVLPES